MTCTYCRGRMRYQYPKTYFHDRIIPCPFCHEGIVPELGGES